MSLKNVTAPAGSTNFYVTSNSNWSVISDQTWCVVTSSGSGNGTIDANYTENTALTTRVATITVTVSGLTPMVVTVTQSAGSPFINVTPPNQDVTYNAGLTVFDVVSNSGWTAISDQPWCTVTPSGTGNGSINATYTENTGNTTRIAHVTTTVSGVTPVVVTVTQDFYTGIDNLAIDDFLIIPNPNNGLFFIKSKEKTGEVIHVDIFDAIGNMVQRTDCIASENCQFDLKAKAKGVYYVRIGSSHSTIVRKIIIQ